MHHPTQFQAIARTREADRMREARAHRAAKQATAVGSSWMVRLLAAFARNVTRLNPFGRVKARPGDGSKLEPHPDVRQ